MSIRSRSKRHLAKQRAEAAAAALLPDALPEAFRQVITETINQNLAALASAHPAEAEQVVQAAMMGAASHLATLWWSVSTQAGEDMHLAKLGLDAAINTFWNNVVVNNAMKAAEEAQEGEEQTSAAS